MHACFVMRAHPALLRPPEPPHALHYMHVVQTSVFAKEFEKQLYYSQPGYFPTASAVPILPAGYFISSGLPIFIL